MALVSCLGRIQAGPALCLPVPHKGSSHCSVLVPALFAVHGRQVWALEFGTSKPKDGSLGPSALVHQPVHARGACRGASMTGGYSAASVKKLLAARLQDS